MTKNTVLVTGGTDTLGRQVVPLLRAAGLPVRVLSRRERPAADGVTYARGDLLGDPAAVAGQLDAALTDVDIVLHLAGGPKGDDVATRLLVDAARRAGVRHLVYISVIGADRLPLGYFRAKHAAERAVAGSGLPYTVLRAAQFHDLAFTVAEKMAKLPLVPAPGGIRWQPVDAREVAARLVVLALGEPAGTVPDLAGPAVYEMGELTRAYLAARGRSRRQLPVRVPGKVGRAYRAGENLAAAGAEHGRRTWEEYLAERLAA
ncbi:SDR family oxidoreductase [Streptomyces sp. CBMA156]|uniref:SDR family oxidoreductase n=1 Tax=Streptomyces sp. CBMA156 TaxID=1930280 RepID=UPI001661C805|nr:NAD(P)H-binding protein [Streptomyces sp. CBMA156]MBD0670110.1 NmrA family transcriptional regulator [Streptomyces sp. CBMA156]